MAVATDEAEAGTPEVSLPNPVPVGDFNVGKIFFPSRPRFLLLRWVNKLCQYI